MDSYRKTHTRSLLKFLIRAFVFIFLVLIEMKIAPMQQAQALVENLIVVGEEEYVLGPRNDFPDFPFFTTPIDTGLRGYQSGGGSTTTYFGPNLDSMTIDRIAMTHGPAGFFDECGVWLMSTYKIDAEHWVGWYHAEEDCDYSIGLTHKSMAFAESFDSGRTWTKPNYPNNRIITADTANNGNTAQDDAGDGKVLKIGNVTICQSLFGNRDEQRASK